MHTVLILGGYGFFGSRISAVLSKDSSLRVLIGGRNGTKARLAAKACGLTEHNAIEIDSVAPDFSARLKQLGVSTLVHTAGPFQGQDYAVARAAIAAGCHYVDLADAREFVTGIESLHELAKAKGITVISGASTAPALTTAVIDRYAARFSSLESIKMAVSTGARTPGLATIKRVFGYCGKPFQPLENGRWVDTHGWLDLRRYRFPQLGTRLLGSCEVPDLDLLPKRYPSLRTVKFHAGFANPFGHLVVWSIAGLVRIGLLSNANAFASPLDRLSKWAEPWISDQGGMYVKLGGKDHTGKWQSFAWHVLAAQNHGPNIPCGASIALVRKLSVERNFPRGAAPCVGFLTIDEYLAPLQDFDIRIVTDA